MEFIKVNVNEYVKKWLEEGFLLPRTAVKFSRIIARQGTIGEEVKTYYDKGLLEKVSEVKLDNQTKQPGWIATKVDESGQIMIDEYGNKNEWIIDDTTFKKKYEVDIENPMLFKPKGGPQIFVEIPDNIILEQWGSEMNIEKGGYINITNVDDMYGISKRDFEDTYRFVGEEIKKTK